ncbi:UNVERIFIED_CONTAM: La protein 1 [Sesamum latifolium]|uniref:La protein 1 n=1 Tax=Sesamum latifolium TaxID=2727402 RepID=A0AAW2SNP2_9LAMI
MAPATSLDEETAKKVIRQVEFYFSDSNLPRDAFLKKTISESDDGMVSLALISSFSRMRGHLGLGDVKPEDVSEDTVKAVAETLRTSTFLKVSEDGKKVGRVTELAKPEEVNSVRLPRHVVDNRLFCGTALIEFSSEEDASNILKLPSYSGVELELKPKKDFDTERAKQEEEAAKTRTQVGSNRREKANAEPDYPKGLIVAFKLKSISAEDSTTQNGNHESVSDDADVIKKDGEQDKTQVNSEETGQDVADTTTNNVENAGKDEEEEAAKTGAETESQEPEDAEKSPDNQDDQGSGEGKTNIASYKDNKDVVLREDLKSIFQKFGTVKFIDFKIGSDSGYVRFEDAGAAQKARAAAVLTEEGGLIVKNFIATLDPVTGLSQALSSSAFNFLFHLKFISISLEIY